MRPSSFRAVTSLGGGAFGACARAGCKFRPIVEHPTVHPESRSAWIPLRLLPRP